MSGRGAASGATRAIEAIRAAALAHEGAFEAHPWGETVFKAANKKVFVFTSHFEGVLRICCKLPHGSEAAVTMFGFCAPTGYGLGQSGWVTATFPDGADVPLPMLLEWMEESYAAVAGAKAAARSATAEKKRQSAIRAKSRDVAKRRSAAARAGEQVGARPGPGSKAAKARGEKAGATSNGAKSGAGGVAAKSKRGGRSSAGAAKGSR